VRGVKDFGALNTNDFFRSNRRRSRDVYGDSRGARFARQTSGSQAATRAHPPLAAPFPERIGSQAPRLPHRGIRRKNRGPAGGQHRVACHVRCIAIEEALPLGRARRRSRPSITKGQSRRQEPAQAGAGGERNLHRESADSLPKQFWVKRKRVW